jgi:hypothetical protein
MFTSRKGYTVSLFFFSLIMTLIILSLSRSEGYLFACFSRFFFIIITSTNILFSLFMSLHNLFSTDLLYTTILYIHIYTSGMKRDASQNQLGRGFVDTRKLQLITYTSFIDYYLIIIGFGFRFFLTLFTIMNLVIVLCSGGDFSFSLIGFLFLLFLYDFFFFFTLARNSLVRDCTKQRGWWHITWNSHLILWNILAGWLESQTQTQFQIEMKLGVEITGE